MRYTTECTKCGGGTGQSKPCNCAVVAMQEDRRKGVTDRRTSNREHFLARIRLTLDEMEPRTNYRTPVGQLVFAVQVAAAKGFALQVVAAGSMYATFALSNEERAELIDNNVSLQLDT